MAARATSKKPASRKAGAKVEVEVEVEATAKTTKGARERKGIASTS